MDHPLLRIRGLSKAFGWTRALDRVDLDVDAGRVVALVGENGAGKSTLIRILAGVDRADAGTILLRGGPAHPKRVASVHQDLGLVDSMTVAENLALVDGYRRRAGLIDWRRTRHAARAALTLVGGGINPSARVSGLSRTDRCLVAVARALAASHELLVLDEPTANLPTRDVERLFTVLRELRDRGVGMVYVSHRVDEVLQLADRVAVLRDGRLVANVDAGSATEADLVRLSSGRRLARITAPAPPPQPHPILVVDGLVAPGAGPLSFTLAGGEALGLAGLNGAGQEQVTAALAGDVPMLAGRAVLDGREFRPSAPVASVARGVARCTAHREENLAMPLMVRENLFATPGWTEPLLSARAERLRAHTLLRDYGVRPAEPDRTVGTLSGGNQQKVILARCINLGRRLLLLEEPTAGVDMASKADIYALLERAMRAGRAVLLVSTDVDVITQVCHRALIFRGGQPVADLAGSALTAHAIAAAASGAAA